MLELKVDGFSGPLGLLLDRIAREQLDITVLSLAQVADQYWQHVESNGGLEPDALADFILIGSRLLYLKSCALPPPPRPRQGGPPAARPPGRDRRRPHAGRPRGAGPQTARTRRGRPGDRAGHRRREDRRALPGAGARGRTARLPAPARRLPDAHRDRGAVPGGAGEDQGRASLGGAGPPLP